MNTHARAGDLQLQHTEYVKHPEQVRLMCILVTSLMSFTLVPLDMKKSEISNADVKFQFHFSLQYNMELTESELVR